MLPTNPSASSIQRRRQLHRRQQSLEVPILAPPLAPNPRRNNATRPGHRRGFSLDQNVNAAAPTTGFRPLISQNSHHRHTGPPSARTQHPDMTLTPEQQHFIKQEPQEHSLAQPGFDMPPQAMAQAFDFQSHLHQQLNGVLNPSANPTPPEQMAAMQSLQSHLMWYQQNFGAAVANPNLQTTAQNQIGYPVAGDMAALGFSPQSQMPNMSSNISVPRASSQTVPSTPQQQSWPSPPPSHIKRSRSHSTQLDVAPMPMARETASFIQSAPCGSYQNMSFPGASQLEQDYAASAYSSSIADPSSPSQQHATPLPTLFEESAIGAGIHDHAEDLLLQAAAGAAEPDFNDPSFMVGGGSLCPEQQALDAAGIDATYIDTGISEDELNAWLVHPGDKNEPYHCKFEGCKAKINRKENARSHVQNHLDDRRFQCNPCGKRFSRMHDTKRHFLTHTQERPAVCPCGKTFARADALTRHRQRDMCEGVLPGFEKAEEERPKRGRPKKDRSQFVDDNTKGMRNRARRPEMEDRMQKAALARMMDRVNAASSTSGASDRSMPDTPPHDSDAITAADFLNLDDAHDQFTNATSTWLDTPPTSPPCSSSSPAKATRGGNYIDMSANVDLHSISPSKLSAHSSPVANLATHPPSLQEGSSPFADPSDALLSEYSSPAAFQSTAGFHGGSSPLGDPTDVFDSYVMEIHPDVGVEAFSPPGASESSSSSYHSDYDTVHGDMVKPGGGMAADAFFGNPAMTTRHAFGGIDDFLNTTHEPQPYDDFRDMLDAWIAQN